MLLLLVFLASTYWLLGNGTANGNRLELEKKTRQSLTLAKQALIGRSAVDANRPGSLPCPDGNGDGLADMFAGNNCPTYLGRLPWKTLDVPELRDGYSDDLWYVLAPALRDNVSAKPINPSKAPELTLDGTPDIAAIIFSAGPPLTGQNGRPGDAVADYLDGSNVDGDFAYLSGPQSENFNDQALVITREELFQTVNKRVLREIRGPDNSTPSPPSYGLRHFMATNPNLPMADSDGDGFGDTSATGTLPYKDLGMDSAANFPPYDWMEPNTNAWLTIVGYQRLSASSARISIGSSQMDVVPCTSSPCP